MKRILVVDDDPPVARLIGAALKAADVEHTIDYCSDGGQAKVKLGQGGYDLVTLDLAMPLMDGMEALEQMKRDPRCAGIPVVIITAHDEEELHQRALALGAAAVLTKPFTAQAMGDLLRRVLAGEAQPGAPGSGLRPLS
ncbi:MAG: response regulator [Armatimonadota bacterium]